MSKVDKNIIVERYKDAITAGVSGICLNDIPTIRDRYKTDGKFDLNFAEPQKCPEGYCFISADTCESEPYLLTLFKCPFFSEAFLNVCGFGDNVLNIMDDFISVTDLIILPPSPQTESSVAYHLKLHKTLDDLGGLSEDKIRKMYADIIREASEY